MLFRLWKIISYSTQKANVNCSKTSSTTCSDDHHTESNHSKIVENIYMKCISGQTEQNIKNENVQYNTLGTDSMKVKIIVISTLRSKSRENLNPGNNVMCVV